MVTLKITRKPARRWVTISLDPGVEPSGYAVVVADCTCSTYVGTRVAVRNLGCQCPRSTSKP